MKTKNEIDDEEDQVAERVFWGLTLYKTIRVWDETLIHVSVCSIKERVVRDFWLTFLKQTTDDSEGSFLTLVYVWHHFYDFQGEGWTGVNELVGRHVIPYDFPVVDKVITYVN